MAEFRATGFASVPAGVALLLNERGSVLDRYADQLQYLEIGSSAMPLAHKRQLMEALPKTRICMHYGLTEASRSAFLSFHDDADRLDSIGRPSPGVEMRIVDQTGTEVDDGVEGEIEVRGDHLMSGYWHDPALSETTLRDGWLRTGDLGYRDANGYFYLKSRTTDMINVGGRKVSPLEIEDVLMSHPAIADCACVGVPDAQGLSGEMISAFLVADPVYGNLPKFSDLAKLLRQNLEPYKIPRRFAWIDEIPKSPSGKVLRRALNPAD
jgi:long-chain acyl-CoA synthetase